MSVIKHLQIDIWNADCIGSTDYYEFPANRPDLAYYQDFKNDDFHIMVDGGEIWSYNDVPSRARMFVGRKLVI